MKSYCYNIVDLIAEHCDTLEDKKPINSATHKQMDYLFLQEASDKGMNANDVLDFDK
ncbi:hypothetical protein [Tenacibaculum aestuariivivum]|uniref:hypothetical protein n=1 Tax=Tenacibaculum aestuariivivum TaxID=2006131 RepID=UPI003AB6A095